MGNVLNQIKEIEKMFIKYGLIIDVPPHFYKNQTNAYVYPEKLSVTDRKDIITKFFTYVQPEFKLKDWSIIFPPFEMFNLNHHHYNLLDKLIEDEVLVIEMTLLKGFIPAFKVRLYTDHKNVEFEKVRIAHEIANVIRPGWLLRSAFLKGEVLKDEFSSIFEDALNNTFNKRLFINDVRFTLPHIINDK